MNAIAYASPLVPAEWIAAHGFRPHWLRLRSSTARPALAAARGVCPYVRAVLDAATPMYSSRSARGVQNPAWPHAEREEYVGVSPARRNAGETPAPQKLCRPWC